MARSHRATADRRTSKPTQPTPSHPRTSERSGARWLLLIHQIPPKPDYLRVKIGRRLQAVGAMAIKNSVYALPPTPECLEDFQWIAREIEEGGGDAFISEASLVGEGLTDEAVRARFSAARGQDYRALLRDARTLLASLRRSLNGRPRALATSRGRATARSGASGVRPGLEHELAKLRRRYEAVNRIDFFAASDGAAVAALLSEIENIVRQQRTESRRQPSGSHMDGAIWVTRGDVHVDRIASAWLIRRFIDRRPRFRFVDPKRYAHQPGELRFDMFEAEYTHVGDACTFEMLCSTFFPDNHALREIGEIVRDVDCKDAKFRRDEAPGLARMIEGIAALCERDEDRLERGGALFDALYAAFGGGGTE